MDWRLFLSTFGAIFIAEMGDKTQIATFGLAASNAARWTVFFAAAFALVCTSAIGVVLGGAVSRYVPAIWVRRGAGAIFVVMGLLYLFGKGES